MVDINYDVADPDSPTLTVYLKVSADGGTTWKGPVGLVTGDVGRGIVPGAGKRLVWDAGKEMTNQFGVKYRYRIGADDWQVPLSMTLIPAGWFQMGDDRVGGTTPVRTVTLSAFAMDKWEVPIELWESVRGWGNAHGYDLVAGVSYGIKHPVHSVSWWDVVKWCNARSEKEGKVPAYYEDGAMTKVYRSGSKEPVGVKWHAGYRLPTEAEWEKAARGGSFGKLYPWGTDEINPTLANYKGMGGTMPVGSYGANGYGLYDMAGNVWEWCWDWFGDYVQTAQTDPLGPSSGFSRVIRGGSWINYFAGAGQVANRFEGSDRGSWVINIGFRSVLPAGQP